MRYFTAGLALTLTFAAGCGDDGGGQDGASGGSAGAGAGAGGSGATSSGGAGSGGGPGGSGGNGAGAGSAGAAGSGGSGGAVPVQCNDDCHFVRAGESGDGSAWDNALGELPDTLVRGHVYFIADGDYSSYTFDDSGQEPIRIVKATASDHGTDTGWSADFGDGEAVFGPLSFKTGYFELDGRSALRVEGQFQGTALSIAGNHVSVANVDVDGRFQKSGGKHTGGSCTAMSISGDNVSVSGTDIHDAADDGVSINGASNLSFSGNTIHALHGCGTDGNCGPCYNGHSDGLELYAVKDSEIVGNFAYDIASTSALFFGNWADELGDGKIDYCQNILLANNIIYNPQTGFVAYLEDVVGIRVFNNVFWGEKKGSYGGLSVGQNVSELDLYNNVILSINFAHVNGKYDAKQHRGDYNLIGAAIGQWPTAAHDVVAADPLFSGAPSASGSALSNPKPSDFTPKAGSPLLDAGLGTSSSMAIPAQDFFGKARDSSPNIGAIE